LSGLVERLEGMLASGQDGAVLRFGLAQALHREGRAADAAHHLREAVAQEPGYSAAWKLLGRVCLDTGHHEAAGDAWRRGIEAAIARGDKQAAREMEVFLRRLAKASRDP